MTGSGTYLIAAAVVLLLAGTYYFLFRHLVKYKRLASKLEQAVEDLKLIQEVSKEISSKLEMNELLPGIMEAFVKAGNVSKGSLMIYNEDTKLLEIKAAKGLSERAISGVKLRIGEGIAGAVAETGKSILINDTTDDLIYKDFFADGTKGRPKETLLCLPLIFKGEVLGVVTLDSKTTGEQFIRNDERLLSILASQAAVSINNARMYEMAITDGLTKLYIRRHFFHRLHQEIEKVKRYRRPLSLLFMDIDHFKEFNDNYGHQLGDRALVHLATIMRSQTRPADISARYGGEEFVMLLPETPRAEAMAMAERLRRTVEQSPFPGENGMEHRVTISIGVAEYSEKLGSAWELVKRADECLYRAKENGRNQVVG